MLVLFFLVGFNSNTHCVCIKECFCVNRSGLNLFSLSASSPSVSWTSAGKWDAALNPDRKIILNNSPLKLTSQLYIYIFLNPYMNFRPWGRYNSCLNLRTASVKVKFPPADSSSPVRGTRSLPCRNCRGGTRTDPQPRLPWCFCRSCCSTHRLSVCTQSALLWRNGFPPLNQPHREDR